MLLDELNVRRTAMAYLADKLASPGAVVTRAELETFTYDGRPLKLIDQSREIRTTTTAPSAISADANVSSAAAPRALRRCRL